MSSSAHFRLIAVGRVAISVLQAESSAVSEPSARIASATPYAAVAPISGAPRTSIEAIASAAASQVVNRAMTKSCGNSRWSIAPTDQPSGSSQILRRCLPWTFIAHQSEGWMSRPQDPSRYRIQLVQQLRVPRFRCGDQGRVESAVGADRTGLMLAWKILCQTRHQALRLLRIRGQHPEDVLYGHGVVVGMPAIEIRHHGNGCVANLRLAGEFCLRHVGHADHRIAEILVGHAFGIAG